MRQGREAGTRGGDVRRGLADVLDTLQRVDGVGAAEDARSEHDGEGVSRHPVGLLLQSDPETHHRIILLIQMLPSVITRRA